MKRLAIALVLVMFTAIISDFVRAGGKFRCSQRRMRQSLDSWNKKISEEWKNQEAELDKSSKERRTEPPRPGHKSKFRGM